MNNLIYPCIALKGQTEEAADFYINTFAEGKIVQTSPYVRLLDLSGQLLMLLNEGPESQPNAAISIMVTAKSAEETQRYWDKLTLGGKIFMPLDKYPWSISYGWIQDKFGVSWQLFTSQDGSRVQKFTPSLMFTGHNAGKAEEAIHFYTGLFPLSEIGGILEYQEGEGDIPGLIKHAMFNINEYTVTAMDSSADHKVAFNDAISFVVNCKTQDEIDRYWHKLTDEGGDEVACGWLTDKFGISWQIVPDQLGTWISDPVHGQAAIAAMMKMKKLIISELQNA
jgi:predicted 3-demethylubiquinone-9 3-methyltransferase (glyoxalase superfamily)